MTDKKPLTPEEISAIVDGLNPIDWAQMELMAKMPPGKRIYPSLHASAMIRAGLRTGFIGPETLDMWLKTLQGQGKKLRKGICHANGKSERNALWPSKTTQILFAGNCI